jgi:hypothetical protein
MVASTN